MARTKTAGKAPKAPLASPPAAVDPPMGSGEEFLIPLADVVLDPANANVHTDESIEAIKGSLAMFRQVTPIVLDAANVVRKGNGTVQAARALGWTAIRAVRLAHEGAMAVAYAIADNQTGRKSRFDQERLGQQLVAVHGDGVALTGLGFTHEELEPILSAQGTGLTGIKPDPPKLNFEGNDDAAGEDGGDGGDVDPGTPPPSQVRMVQLFFDSDSFAEFVDQVEALQEVLGTKDTSETVHAVIRRAHDEHCA